MARLTFVIDGQNVELEGTVEEVAAFLKILQKENITLAKSEEERKRIHEQAQEKVEVDRVKKNLPSVKDIKKFVLSQSKYRHSTFSIQTHFFGRTFKARGVSEGLYHMFLELTTKARQIIEHEQVGRFQYSLHKGRHKVYYWEAGKKGN